MARVHPMMGMNMQVGEKNLIGSSNASEIILCGHIQTKAQGSLGSFSKVSWLLSKCLTDRQKTEEERLRLFHEATFSSE